MAVAAAGVAVTEAVARAEEEMEVAQEAARAVAGKVAAACMAVETVVAGDSAAV